MSQCWYLILSTASGSVLTHYQGYRWQISDWGDRLRTKMKLYSFSSMSLFSLHLLLALKVLFMFYNWTIPAQLQQLQRAGLRLWSTGDLFNYWQNCFWAATSCRCRCVRKEDVVMPSRSFTRAGSQEYQILQIANPAGSRGKMHAPSPAKSCH